MKLHLGHLLGLTAIIVAGCAAFFSVFGLSQLFAGASIAVIVMASALELSKLVAATFLHRYWDSISKVLRIYLTVGVIVLVTITSAGIYGFLSHAYQKTASSYMVHEGELSILDGKIAAFNHKIENNAGLIETKTSRIDQLSKMRAIKETRLDSMINRRYFSNANQTRDEITADSKNIDLLNTEVDAIVAQNNALNDSISTYEIKKLELSASSDVSAELGPLKYMADLSGKPMDVVVNYFILLLIFVFDPLAISLVVATSWVFTNRPKTPKTLNTIKTQWVKKEPKVEPEPEVNEVVEDVTEPKVVEDIVPVTDPEPEKPKEELKPPFRKPLTIEDINEIKKRKMNDGRGFSVDIPKTSSNKVERIGSNKFLEDNKKIEYRNKR